MPTRNYRVEIETALAGGAPDRVPCTIYDGLIPANVDVSALQAKGLALCARRNVYHTYTPQVTVKYLEEQPGIFRTVLDTPIGTLTSLRRRGAYNALAPLEYPIKTRDDYRIAEFIVRDTVYAPAYEEFLTERAKIGDTGITIGNAGDSPMLDIQLRWLGQEQFCYEVMDNPDAVMSLYDALTASQRAMYPLAAGSPAEVLLHCGNLVPEMLGMDIVRDHVFPRYREFAAVLHEHGKLMGAHLDAENHLILELVRDSGIDLIEAFTPPPDCAVSVAQARASWPGKRLWINFPSSMHLAADDDIRQATEEIITQAGDRRGFLIGITEDIPTEHLLRSMSIILEVINSRVV